MKPRQLRRLAGPLEILAILVLHCVLLHWLAEKNVVATMLAAGPNVPLTTLMLAGLFLLLRLLAILCLPGIILSRLGLLAFDRWRVSRDGGEGP